MRCPVTGSRPRQTFHEQVQGVLDRYQWRTTRLTGPVSAVTRVPSPWQATTRELAGRAGACLLPALGILFPDEPCYVLSSGSRSPRPPCREFWGSTTSRCPRLP